MLTSNSLDVLEIKRNSLSLPGSRSVKVQRVSTANLSAARANTASVDPLPHQTFWHTSVLKPIQSVSDRHRRRLADVRLPAARA